MLVPTLTTASSSINWTSLANHILRTHYTESRGELMSELDEDEFIDKKIVRGVVNA